MNLEKFIRPSIFNLKAYSSARDEFKGEASVFVDANENPLRDKYNRYPDPLQWKLKDKIAKIKGIDTKKIFLGNGSDEPIDVSIRVFCEPRIDNIVAIDPTYGMYEVCANINDIAYRKVLLNEDYTLDADRVLSATDEHTKIIFLCSPNNPTGNLLDAKEVEKIITSFDGIVIVDEAYIDFAPNATLLPELDKYPNLIVLQTFSKAWGLAAVRLGMAFASPEIISYFNKVKYPYNINALTQEFVSEAIENEEEKKGWVETIIRERENLIDQLPALSFVEMIYPTNSNFVLLKVNDANAIYKKLADRGVIVRNRNSVSLCGNCLRITVGSEKENQILIETMRSLE